MVHLPRSRIATVSNRLLEIGVLGYSYRNDAYGNADNIGGNDP